VTYTLTFSDLPAPLCFETVFFEPCVGDRGAVIVQ